VLSRVGEPPLVNSGGLGGDHQDGESGGEGHGDDEADGADQSADDLDGHDLAGGEVADRAAGSREQQEQGSEAPA